MLSIRSRLKVFRLLVITRLVQNLDFEWYAWVVTSLRVLHTGGGGKELGQDSWHPFSKGGGGGGGQGKP